MAKRVQTLSPALLQEIRELITERQNQRPLGQPQMEDPGDLPQASDIFVVRSPEDGIPATSGVDVGWGECEVYFLFDDGATAELEPTGQVLRIYNLSDTAVEADAYCLVTKTKFGQWIVTSNLGSGVTTTNSCALTKLKGNDCLKATVTPGGVSVIMEGDGAGHWDSLTDLNYGYGVGPLEFWFENGLPHLMLDGLELMYCGNGCWSGGELTGHLTNTGSATGECMGVSFEVCLECWTCVPPPVTVPCCDNPIPAILNAYIGVSGLGGTGSCGCFIPPVNISLTYASGTGDWRYSGTLCGSTSVFRFYCEEDTFKIEGVSGCTFAPVSIQSNFSCIPLHVEYNIPLGGFSCCDPTGVGLLVIISETP